MATTVPRSSAKSIEKRLFPSSCVRNKLRRQSLYKAERSQRSKDRKQRRERRKKEREQLGDKVGSTGTDSNTFPKRRLVSVDSVVDDPLPISLPRVNDLDKV